MRTNVLDCLKVDTHVLHPTVEQLFVLKVNSSAAESSVNLQICFREI